MTLGVFVEGQSDRTTIPILIRKIGYQAGIHRRVVRQGDMLDLTEMSNQINSLLRTQSRVRRILVMIDSEGEDPSSTERRTTNISRELNRVARPVPVDYIVVDHSLEGWLACDVEALRAVLGRNARVRIRGNPENNLRPATVLERVFRDNGRDFRKTVHNPRIAELVTIQTIAEKSPTFTRLVSVLRGAAT